MIIKEKSLKKISDTLRLAFLATVHIFMLVDT